MNIEIVNSFLLTPGGERAAWLLRNHRRGPGDLLAAIETELVGVLPHLIHGVLYSTEVLCGPDLWNRLRYDGVRRAAGMCLAYLVACQVVPLQLHWTPSGKGPKRYMLKVAPTFATTVEVADIP